MGIAMKIKEIIVVEGRDDTAAIKKSVDAVTIETHGYGITKDTWSLLEKAYHEKGIIIFTDPDHAGEQIRKRVLEKFPGAGEAFLDRKDAQRDGDIGIENAAPESIREALEKAHYSIEEDAELFTMEDLRQAGLAGSAEASERRQKLGKALGIGWGNSKRFLQKLNKFGITRAELDKALREI